MGTEPRESAGLGAPGGQVTFSFYVTAPYNSGTYKMVQDGVEWFGDATPNASVSVFASPTCYPYQEQSCWNSGGSWDSSTCQCYGGGGCWGNSLRGKDSLPPPCYEY